MKILKNGLFAILSQMSFLESVLLKNGFYFICILYFPFFVIRFLFGPFHFALFLGNTLSFVGLAKTHGTGREGFQFSKLFFFLNLFRKIFLPLYSHLFYSLKSSNVRVLEAQGLAESITSGPPYSVREWCRFLTKLSRLLSKSDCFQPVSFDSLCNPQFRCRGVSIISFACVMTDSSTLKNSQTAAEGPQSSIFVSHLCLLAEMYPQ